MDQKAFEALRRDLKGELYNDEATLKLYATDASAYRELPQAVATPKDSSDIKKLVKFAPIRIA